MEPKSFYSMKRIKELAERDPENHFFDADTVAYFGTRTYEKVCTLPGKKGALFVTSDYAVGGEPTSGIEYKIRRAYVADDGKFRIVTVGDPFKEMTKAFESLELSAFMSLED